MRGHWTTRANRAIAGVLTLVLIAALVAAPTRHGYSMDQMRSLVNRIRPGTFPELDADRQKQAPPAVREAPRHEALTDTERQILLSLMDRKRQLDERDAMLNQREEQLRALRDNIQQQVAELKRLQTEIEASMDAKKAQDAENLQRVVTLYNGMDPRAAALKLEQLEPNVAVQILMGMNQRKAAQLLEALPADKAKRITEAIVSKVPIASS
jgi:flagellar motility protein MotE (MotC chaperone)